MCGRYTLRRINWYRDVKGFLPAPFEEFSENRVRFNVAPSQLLPIIVNEDGAAIPQMARWGLIPSWTKGKPKIQPINAKCETAATSGMFRQSMARRRCLVPADGFYEWMGAKPPKVPHFIRMRDDGVFAFAGLWDRWRADGRAGPVDTFTIITTTPNELMQPIHNRMPVILDPAGYGRWLDAGAGADDVADLLRPYPAERMEAFSVSTRVNNVRNDAPDLVEPST